MSADPRNPSPRREELIDELLDSALPRDAVRDAYEALRGDAAACEDLARLRYAVARLSAPVQTPDLSDAILSQVDVRRRFLSHRRRRLVTAGRLGVAAGVVVAVGLASFVQRSVPQVNLAERDAPVSRVVETAQASAGENARIVEHTVETIQSTLASPVARLSLSPSYRPEDGLRFDLSIPPAPEAAAQPTTLFATGVGAPRPAPAPAPQFAGVGAPAASNPFIDRFGPLLVILRDPPPVIDDEASAIDDR